MSEGTRYLGWPGRPARTLDLTTYDYSWRPTNGGQTGTIACWTVPPGGKPRPGQYLILRNGTNRSSRYRVVSVNLCMNVDPPTMWMAECQFAPRSGGTPMTDPDPQWVIVKATFAPTGQTEPVARFGDPMVLPDAKAMLIEMGWLDPAAAKTLREAAVDADIDGAQNEVRPPGAAPDLTAIRARADAATPGPWHRDHGAYGCVQQGDFGWVTPGPGPEYEQDTEQGMADAEFVAHARTDIPDLLEAIDRLRGQVTYGFQARDGQAALIERLQQQGDDARNASLARDYWARDVVFHHELPEQPGDDHYATIAKALAAALKSVDAHRAMTVAANTALRTQLLAALGVDDDGRTPLDEYVTVLAAERDTLRQYILDIDAHATPYGDLPDEPGWIGTYLLSAGALHRALGKIGHSAPNCTAEADVELLRQGLIEANARCERYALAGGEAVAERDAMRAVAERCCDAIEEAVFPDRIMLNEGDPWVILLRQTAVQLRAGRLPAAAGDGGDSVERLIAERDDARGERDAAIRNWVGVQDELERLLPIVKAARAFLASEATRTDRSITASDWLEQHGIALHALRAAVDALPTPTEAGNPPDDVDRAFARQAQRHGQSPELMTNRFPRVPGRDTKASDACPACGAENDGNWTPCAEHKTEADNG